MLVDLHVPTNAIAPNKGCHRAHLTYYFQSHHIILLGSMHQSPLLLLMTLSLSGAIGCTWQSATTIDASPGLTLEMFRSGDAPCYDRSVQPQTSVVDTHVHFRPFGGPAIPFEEVLQYFEETGVLFANVYGIGQMLPVTSSCMDLLPGLPRHAGDADAEERLRQRRQLHDEGTG